MWVSVYILWTCSCEGSPTPGRPSSGNNPTEVSAFAQIASAMPTKPTRKQRAAIWVEFSFWLTQNRSANRSWFVTRQLSSLA
jgi:hypothetical protein